jgi:integrase
MARHSRTGVRGLARLKSGRFRIDLRWRDARTGLQRRHMELLPANLPAAAAKRRAQETLAAALTGELGTMREPKRLSEALEDYCKWADDNRPLTADDRRSRANVLKEGLGDIFLDDISAFRVERFKRDRLAENPKPAPATVNRALAYLKHACGLFVGWGWMKPEVADAIRKVRLLKEPPGRVRYLSADEEARLVGALAGKPHVAAVVVAAALSGMRRGEVLGLRRDAVDLRHMTITLQKTKSNKVRRIPICDQLVPVLEEAIKKGGEFVFLNRRGKPWTVDGFKPAWYSVVAAAKLEDFHFHDLRHDFATKLRRRGVGLDVIAQLLGHASLAMTQRYAHVEQDLLRKAVARLPRLAAPTPIAAPLPHAKRARASK